MGRTYRVRSGLYLMLRHANVNAYVELYQEMQRYNSLKPFHEDTGVRFSMEERIASQKANIKTLAAKAKATRVSENISFRLVSRTKIQMSLDGKVYKP